MKINRNILFIANVESWKEEHPAFAALEKLESALLEMNFEISFAWSLKEGLTALNESPKYSAIGIYWDVNNKQTEKEVMSLISTIRSRNDSLPIFLIAERDIMSELPLHLIKEVKEYIYLFSETPTFTANRIRTAIYQYNKQLLPPYFKTLKDFTEDGDYYWDCPGHMGGMAYLKHPVGVEFFNFFGENMFRADIGVATAEMGDYLIHAGPPKKSEEIAAELFGADWTFYALAGSSGSNRIVTQGAVAKDEIAVVDRNCHKSLNHGLTLSGARPVYFKPTRNAYGLIGPIPNRRLKKAHIESLIKKSALSKEAVCKTPAYAVVTNCTYDGFCYNATKVVDELKDSVARIHFDEAWYAYAKFHPIYKDRFAMGVSDKIKNMPTLFAVQSTHKMLPALSMASMIHIKKSARAPLDYDDFNDSFMMHSTTSPYYPILASIDVAVNMMQGNSGKSLVQESIEEAVAFRKAVVAVKRKLKEENSKDWFFDVFQPTEVKSAKDGKKFSFEEAPMKLLTQDPDCWTLKSNEKWHGFAKEDVEDMDAMLDPVKVTLTCPGVNADGSIDKVGIPGCVVTKFLDDRRTEIARTGDYTLLILFSCGVTKGKWGTLIESLLEFKHLYDSNAKATDAIPSLASVSEKYAKMTLKELCQSMHQMMTDYQLMKHSAEAVSIDPEPVFTPSEAYQQVLRYKAEHIKLKDFAGRIAASMLVPYPPGIPVLMPGERVPNSDKGIIGYLKALQEFDKNFPGFEHELQGVNVDENGEFWLRALIEDDKGTKNFKEKPFRQRKLSTANKKGRQ
ncbi:MAG: Orn/Lys/Arg decarboxylase N-terminal domain-containing protein [Alphaproteobacteria bacterium]|nr:Orn/Lys/Arg decarboxylase N-terminal domain-containing protein [Alphaproteobacteria bacterium]